MTSRWIMNVMISSILEPDQHFSQKYDWKIWLKFFLHLFLTMSQIPLDIILLYVFFHLRFFAQSVVSISCNYSLSGDDYNQIFTCLWCEAEMFSRWLWINAIYVSRTSWPMSGKSHVAFARKYFMWNVSHCLQSIWYLYKITVSHGIALIVYKLYFHSTILKMI